MKALHLYMDHNFVSNSRKVFEQYYPGQNISVIHCIFPQLKMVRDGENFLVYNLEKEENRDKVFQLASKESVDSLVLHGMMPYMPSLVKRMKEELGVKIYWVFWGYELYETLAFEKGYKLLDEPFHPFRKDSYYKPYAITKILRRLRHKYRPEAFLKIMPLVDYFCFWNKRDYDLLKRYYDFPMKYRFFAYCANVVGQVPQYLFDLKERATSRIMINHQATIFGNHATIFKKLHTLDRACRYEKIVPLSYGFATVRATVLKQGKKWLGDTFKPMLGYLPTNEYFDILESVDVAIFGQRRQEASGNIIQLLKNGVKVFLRNDNNLLQYYRERGYIIFSFEDDLKEESDLRSLTLEQKQHNRKTYLDGLLYYSDYMPHFFDD